MDRLPTELLRMITDSIEADPNSIRRSGALAALTRTNKIFYTICHPRLYQHPILTSGRRMMKWGRFYGTKLNPWNIQGAEESLADVIVPESITLACDPEVDAIPKADTTVPLPRTFIDGNLFVKLELFPFFLRNLTTLCVSKDFHVSKDFPINHDFIIALIGPLGSNRSSIKTLSILAKKQYDRLNPFLLGSFMRMEYGWYELDIDILKTLTIVDDEDRQWLDRCVEDDVYPNMTPEWDKLESRAHRFADADYKIFTSMTLIEEGPYEENLEDIWDEIEATDYVVGHPFNKLETLTIAIEHIWELWLILMSRQFPELSHLKVVGKVKPSIHFERDVKLFRHSVTKRKGTITPFTVPDSLALGLGDVNRSRQPLSQDELEDGPEIHYVGPDLVSLDLSECQFVAHPGGE